MNHCQIIHMSFIRPHRLRLPNGGYVYMEWHPYCGPAFFYDRDGRRPYDDWWENSNVVAALDWFIDRGEKS